MIFFFNDTATTEIYTYGHTRSLHDALPISSTGRPWSSAWPPWAAETSSPCLTKRVGITRTAHRGETHAPLDGNADRRCTGPDGLRHHQRLFPRRRGEGGGEGIRRQAHRRRCAALDASTCERRAGRRRRRHGSALRPADAAEIGRAHV